MNNINAFSIGLSVFFFLFAGSSAFAQNTAIKGLGYLGKSAPSATRIILQNEHKIATQVLGTRTMTRVPNYRPIENITYVPAAPTHLLPSAQAAATAKPAVKPLSAPAGINSALARFADKNKRTLINLQTAVGVSTRTAIANAHKLGAQPLQKPRRPALLADRSFITQDFTNLRPSRELVQQYNPAVPFVQKHSLIYRGLGLDVNGAAIRNILENGLLIKDAGEDSNTLRVAYASKGGWSAIKTVIDPVTNLTDAPSSAAFYAGRNLNMQKIRVVVSVKESERGNIIIFTQDIPADKIESLIALLNVNGKPTWCQIELEGEGFKVTPYAPVQK